ncbi:hypothetical protein PoB_000557100 [Plakobranchus ocellatus]|uniref:Uncharacterized protein n=1 Tax=Plakobranchus ocellatus TaxID=259542 RepID=A0AAV3Y765_9GAST|nr:hypothetical protein PoB_000557100 [Plakobranchus ocellatus]
MFRGDGSNFSCSPIGKVHYQNVKAGKEFENEQGKHAYLARTVEVNLIKEEQNAVGVDREFDFGRFVNYRTSRDQRKFIGHQVTLASGGETLSLGFVEIATEDAAILLNVTIGILLELCGLHSPSESGVILEKKILLKLQCTMTDRARDMKKVRERLE